MTSAVMEIETKDEVKQPDMSTYNREEIVNQICSHPMKIVTVDAEMAWRGLQLTRERSQASDCSSSLSRDYYLSSGVMFTQDQRSLYIAGALRTKKDIQNMSETEERGTKTRDTHPHHGARPRRTPPRENVQDNRRINDQEMSGKKR